MRSTRKITVKWLIPSILLLMYVIMSYHLWYFLGRTCRFNSISFYLIASGMIYILLVLFHAAIFLYNIVRAFYHLIKFKVLASVRCFIFAIVILLFLFILDSFLKPFYIPFSKGLESSQIIKEIDEADIIKWLNSYSFEVDMHFTIDQYIKKETQPVLPDDIIILSPSSVVINKTNVGRKYVRLIYNNIFGAYGLVVGIDSGGLARTDSLYRLDINNTMYIWHEIGRGALVDLEGVN